ncbi:coxsackievirus and adenovirus receptor homolog [Centroberyx gerrardi]|uniref:coxsackievirus and adenovirus receptor homolog n=1 Tax=Centroberyx gerrardi TaxID=166262 RepID=UPI003AAF7A7C
MLRRSGAAAFHSNSTQVPTAKFQLRSRGIARKGMEPTIARFCCVLFSILAGTASGLEITSTGPTTIEKASGQSVKLDCHFTLAPEDSGPLDIEWSLLASDNQKEDKVVILYSGDRAYEDYYPAMKGRAHFNSADPKNGDASINLTGLKSSDTGTYQCKVKKAPGIRSRKMLLTVMVKPSKPRCYAEGPTEEGKDVVLRCLSSEGTNPLQYTWEKTSDSNLLPASAVLDPVGGTMNVRNASAGASGTYRCTANNRVGSEECVLRLNITPPPNTAGIIAGAIIAVLLILIIIAIILFCCCRARHRKKYEKEICNEIREDVPPPKSRVSTARSFTSVGSQRSSLGSMSPSNLHEYALKPQYDKIPSSEEFERPPSHAPLPPPTAPKMAGPNLSRMGAIPVMIPAQNRDGSIV